MKIYIGSVKLCGSEWLNLIYYVKQENSNWKIYSFMLIICRHGTGRRLSGLALVIRDFEILCKVKCTCDDGLPNMMTQYKSSEFKCRPSKVIKLVLNICWVPLSFASLQYSSNWQRVLQMFKWKQHTCKIAERKCFKDN